MYKSKPGAPPGMFEVHTAAGSSTLHAIRYNEASIEEFDVTDLAELDTLVKPETVTWLDIQGLEQHVLTALVERLALHPLAVEDAVHQHQRAKVESYPQHELLIARMLHQDGTAITTEQVSVFLGDGVVVTIQEAPGDPFESVRARLRAGRGRIRRVGADYLTYALVDAIVDYYFPILEALDDQLEDLEDRISTASGSVVLGELHALRRSLGVVRRVVWPVRDALQSLVRGDIKRVEEGTRLFLRDTLDHVLRALELTESLREMAASLMDLYLSTASQKMNEAMRVLTVIATIFIPLTFIAGVYGMNFDPQVSAWNMPETKWALGYPVVMGVMIAVGVALAVYFWRAGWFGSRGGTSDDS